MTDNLEAFDRHMDAIRRKLDSMPTKRELLAFILGFVMCAAVVFSVLIFAAVRA